MSDITPNELVDKIDYGTKSSDKSGNWMHTTKNVQIRPGMYCYAAKPESVETLGLPNARAWNPLEEDWKLPDNWQEIVFNGLKERLEKLKTYKNKLPHAEI